MKIALLIIPILLISCQKESLFNNWQNEINPDRQLKLDLGKQGKNKAAFTTDKGCHFDIDVKGREDLGEITIVSKKEKLPSHCQQNIPLKMQYQTMGDGHLKVCSDLSDGRHVCESMTKQHHN